MPYEPALDVAASVDQRERRGREVGGPADQRRHVRGGDLEHLLGGLAGRDLGPWLEALEQARGQRRRAALEDRLELVGERRMSLAVGGHALVPLALGLLAAADRRAAVLERLGRHVERRLGRPAVDLLRQSDLLLAERRSVGAGAVLLVGGAGGDVGAADDQRRSVIDRHRRARGVLDALDGEVLAEVLDVPAVGLVTRADVLAEGELGVALDRDVVVVVEGDQPAEPEMAGERGGLR